MRKSPRLIAASKLTSGDSVAQTVPLLRFVRFSLGPTEDFEEFRILHRHLRPQRAANGGVRLGRSGACRGT